jgi:hypothetical protein
MSLEQNHFSYPHDLALFVQQQWNKVSQSGVLENFLPDLATLENFISGCYHASMLREEERPVTFRAILAHPSLFSSTERPPDGLLRLEFSKSFHFHPSELRSLSVSTDSQRTLIGVCQDDTENRELIVWGLVNSGTRWLREVQGGRLAGPVLPPVLVAHAEAPGSIEVFKGYESIAILRAGKITGERQDLFDSSWLSGQFVEFRERLFGLHQHSRQQASAAGESWALLEPTLPRQIAVRMTKRVISILREERHGGAIIFLPVEQFEDFTNEHSFIDLKYHFASAPGRRSFSELVVAILNRLAKIHGNSANASQELVGWQHFEASTDTKLASLDEALFEMANLIANLASADGAVILNKHHEIIGFGGMISGRLPSIKKVAKAHDLEGKNFTEEATNNVGARHRSAYRLTGGLPGSVAIVVSQDGGVRFVCQKEGRVTYWEHE